MHFGLLKAERRLRRGKSVGLLAALVVFGAASCGAALNPAVAPAKVAIGDQFHGPVLEAPRTLQLWVSDGLVKLKWRGWGSARTTAKGLISSHSGGRYTYKSTRVVAWGIRSCGGKTIYGRLSYTQNGRTVRARLSSCRFSGG